jgi:2-C-methyl-D-erythritol 2,4-cyclodiphosphate synthase
MTYRVGIGFDAHRFEPGRKLILGGVEIPHDRGLSGHSDADVLLHALTDALLGAAALGDIGQHFPDSDPKWKNASSKIFVESAMQTLHKKSLRVANVDLTILAESPRLSAYRENICHSIAALLQIPEDCVNLKATTTDQMGFIGRNEGIAAQAIVLLEQKP